MDQYKYFFNIKNNLEYKILPFEFWFQEKLPSQGIARWVVLSNYPQLNKQRNLHIYNQNVLLTPSIESSSVS